MSAQTKCAICGKAFVVDEGSKRFAPFCSKRCADLDLGRWLKGSYAIPGPPSEETPDAPKDAGEEE